MKEKSGITLITLVITIILLLILAGVSISVGTESINNAKKTRFDAELRVIHTRVNELLEEMSISEIGQMLTANNYDYSIPNDKNSKAITAVGSSNIENYWYFNKTGLEKLGVLSINREVLINFSTREVVDLEGIDHNGEKIYRLLDWENIAHVDKTAGSVPTFSLSKKVYGLNATIIVNNLSYGESVSRGTISYCLLNQDGTDGEWKQASGIEIPVSVSGTYKVRVTNTAETPISTMHTINITLTNQPKLDSGMVPVVYVEANPEGYWKIADENGGEWYDYSSDNDKWANVMLLDGLTVEGNITVTNANKIDLIGRRVTTPGSIRTWLPRCMYKHGNNSEEITDIKFLKGSTNIATDNTNEPILNTGATDTWSVHSSFSENNEELTGRWISWLSRQQEDNNNILAILTNPVYSGTSVFDFAYVEDANGNGYGQIFQVPITGIYKLEAWGASGNTPEELDDENYGYGGYSVGTVSLTEGTNLFLHIGGQGKNGIATIAPGGYNGGGSGKDWSDGRGAGGGGGATHIAKINGILQNIGYEQAITNENVYIVAGGGGGIGGYKQNFKWQAGSGGGATGGTGITTYNTSYFHGTGGTQIAPGEYITNHNYAEVSTYCGESATFGLGGTVGQSTGNMSGGGGGLYGGSYNTNGSGAGGGGSGYIGYRLLNNKKMVMYSNDNSFINNDINAKTEITQNVSTNPISSYAKKGNGYARITLISVPN